MVTECSWTLKTRNALSVGPNNLLQVPVSMDNVSLSIVAVSMSLVTNTNLCGLNYGVSRT